MPSRNSYSTGGRSGRSSRSGSSDRRSKSSTRAKGSSPKSDEKLSGRGKGKSFGGKSTMKPSSRFSKDSDERPKRKRDDYPQNNRQQSGNSFTNRAGSKSSSGFSKDSDDRSKRKRDDYSSNKRQESGKSFTNRAGSKSSSGFSKDSDDRSKRKRDDYSSSERQESGKSFANRSGSKSSSRFSRESDDRPKRKQGEHFDDTTREKGFFKKGRPNKSSRFADKKGKYSSSSEDSPAQTEKVRLNKFIANSGVCSRREADELITMGLISVNGKAVTELGYKVNPGDVVRYENKVLRAEKPVYILMNKPKGYLTTTNDPQERNTVMHLLGNAVKERIYPVGRLDRNTTGLLLFTNDGDLADKLMHPSYKVKKIYKVELDRPLTKADFQRLQEGVQLEEGRALVDDVAIISDDGKTVGLEIHIGWNRVVRRIFEALEYQVIKLDRSVYAGLDKKDLPRGHWRFLREEEIIHLKHYK
jgi:23S rRNA pseudouridine2605 synthase